MSRRQFVRHGKFAAAKMPTEAPPLDPGLPAAPAQGQAPVEQAPEEQAPAPQDEFKMYDGPDDDNSPIGNPSDEDIIAIQMSTRYYEVPE